MQLRTTNNVHLGQIVNPVTMVELIYHGMIYDIKTKMCLLILHI